MQPSRVLHEFLLHTTQSALTRASALPFQKHCDRTASSARPMSSLLSPSLPSTSETRVSPPPRKLRESCCNCAKSKLRCTKEKPKCARCARQGRTCYYIPSKRAGRTRAVHLERRESEDADYTIPIRPTVSPSEVAMPQGTTLPRDIQVPMHQSPLGLWTNIPGVTSFNEEYGTPSRSAHTSRIFDMTGLPAYSPTFISNDITNHLEPELLEAHSSVGSNPYYPVFPSPGSNLAMSRDATLIPPMFLTAACSLISPASDPGLDLPPTPPDIPLSSQCSCLNRVSGLLQKLSLESSGGMGSVSILNQTKRHPSDQDKASRWGAGENRRYVEEMITVVECTCSREPYLLSLMSLVAFKIMGVYRIAARGLRRTGSINHRHLLRSVAVTPTIMEPNCSVYNAAIPTNPQSFLGDIRLIQQLINSLSQQLRRLAAVSFREQHAVSGIHATSYTPVADISEIVLDTTEENGSLPLPATLLHQLDVDLRRQFHALSIEFLGGG
ncbi:hypothetical protein F5Y07DRAFT_358187 [Xylaria sp. FL0933]|nr:hypothetical protein F5Y07DRAFT_358187 [Xylaria sp. FL0933]